jgi:F0F1-type ATP synthase membrane subunit c/vacuolar-type H+-ATPase subunit K
MASIPASSVFGLLVFVDAELLSALVLLLAGFTVGSAAVCGVGVDACAHAAGTDDTIAQPNNSTMHEPQIFFTHALAESLCPKFHHRAGISWRPDPG